MFQRISAPLSRLRDDFESALAAKRGQSITQQQEEAIFADVLSKSDYFDFPKYSEYGFSVQKITRAAYAGMFGVGYATDWVVDLIISAGNTIYPIGTVTFKNFYRDCPFDVSQQWFFEVVFSNQVVESMIENKKSFAEAQHLVSNDVENFYNEITNFSALYKKAAQEAKNQYENATDTNLKVQYASLLVLFEKLLANPRDESLKDFNVDQLIGGGSIGYLQISLLALCVLVGVSAFAGGLYGFFTFVETRSPESMFAFLCLFGGMLVPVMCAGISCLIEKYMPKTVERSGSAKAVNDLLEKAQSLSDEAVNSIMKNSNPESKVTVISDPIVKSSSCGTVFSSEKDKYVWASNTAPLMESTLSST